MNVASKDLSEELFKVSGWKTGYWLHNWPKNDNTVEYVVLKDGEDWTDGGVKVGGNICPAYGSGYLLRKLPITVDIRSRIELNIVYVKADVRYVIFVYVPDSEAGYVKYSEEADTPEDALCKLAIELFKKGVLTQEGVNRE